MTKIVYSVQNNRKERKQGKKSEKKINKEERREERAGERREGVGHRTYVHFSMRVFYHYLLHLLVGFIFPLDPACFLPLSVLWLIELRLFSNTIQHFLNCLVSL